MSEDILYGMMLLVGTLTLFYVFFYANFTVCTFPVLLTIIGMFFVIHGHRNLFLTSNVENKSVEEEVKK